MKSIKISKIQPTVVKEIYSSTIFDVPKLLGIKLQNILRLGLGIHLEILAGLIFYSLFDKEN